MMVLHIIALVLVGSLGLAVAVWTAAGAVAWRREIRRNSPHDSA